MKIHHDKEIAFVAVGAGLPALSELDSINVREFAMCNDFDAVKDDPYKRIQFNAIIDPSRIALNPDCGFAPDYGEPPSIDEAYEKLCHLSEAARRLRKRFT